MNIPRNALKAVSLAMGLRDTTGYDPDARLFAPVADPVEE